MSIQALAWAIEQQIPGEPKLVLIALANHADHTTGECRFDPPTIAREAVVPEASLPRYLGALRRNGFLARDDRGKERHYWLQFERDPAIDWSWKAGDHDDEAVDDVDGSRSAPSPGLAPSSFRPSRQAELREKLVPPAPDPTEKRFPVIEGSRAYHAWVKFEKDQGKVAPFVHSIIVEGQTRRGFMRSTLFPPRADEQASA